MSDRYPIKSLVDIARIPPDRLRDFAKELPDIINVIAPLVAMYDAIKEGGVDIPDSAYDDLLRQTFWIDNDKQTAHVTMTVNGEDEPFLDAKFKYGMDSK